tara:strand:+ start:724 stop:1221 length:498 start_codon:yes stop_codon:yes gene_type:complete
MALTRINNQALTGITAAGLPSGTILQVKQASSSTKIELQSEVFVDCLSLSITPSATTSKFLISTFVTGYTQSANGGAIRIMRDATEILDPNNLNSSNQHYYSYHGSTSAYPTFTVSHLDTPSTTSTITYKIQMCRYGAGTGNVWFNGGGANQGSTSSFTVMEIAG